MRVRIGSSCLLLLAAFACRPSTERLAALAAEAEPVIAALERYQTDHHTYPDSLEALVPDYVSTIPERLIYRRESVFADNGVDTFELEMSAGGLIGWFIYWPEEEYPENIFGGRIEEIVDGWCYLIS